MSLIVNQIIKMISKIAPVNLAEDWDNVGLQIGNKNWNVSKIGVALDPSLDVVLYASKNNIDFLITHHPLFLQPLSKIDTNKIEGKIINSALSNKLAIYCMHTNFDNVSGGTNDILANKLELTNIQTLKTKQRKDLYKIVVFSPPESQNIILDTLFSSNAGKIGTYSSCSFRNQGKATFLPENGSTPYSGSKGILSNIDEVRIECIIEKYNLKNTINKLHKVHPYENMAYDIYQLIGTDKNTGLGRIGEIKNSITLKNLIKKVKFIFNLDIVKVSGKNLNTLIKYIAVCSGSGSSAINNAIALGAEAYISGDIGYHHAKSAQAAKLNIIDIGHFHSEHITMKHLTKQLRATFDNIRENITVSECNIESDVFKYV